jgi:protein-arginine kinase activator protein McsA
MENLKVQELFSKAIVNEGFEKYLTYDYMKHMSSEDLNKIHYKVYEIYVDEISKNTLKTTNVFIKNFHKLLEHFIETEDYEKCAFIRDKLNSLIYV